MTQPKAINVPRRSDIPGRATPGPAHGFFTNHETRITKHGLFRPGLRSMKIMVREMSLIRGLGAPAKEMSVRQLLALFKDLSCPLLPTIARHCPLLPAKKMSQAVVASQYGRGSRGPGCVPRAAPRQPGCTVEQTNHETRSFLARGASRREFRGFHESRVTRHESRLFRRWRARVAPPETAVRTTAPAGKSLFPGSPLFTIVHYCSPLFTKKYCLVPVCPRRPVAASLGEFTRHGAASSGYRAACAGVGEWGVSPCLFTVRRSRSASRRAPFAADPVVLRTPWAVAKAQ